jgi:hypothetical protein
MKNLSNDKISIQIADHGAELVSIYGKPILNFGDVILLYCSR